MINGLGGGGTERSLADLLPELRDRDVDVSVLTLGRGASEGIEASLRERGFEIRAVGQRGLLRTGRALRSAVAERDPDVVHTMLFDSNLLGRLATVGLRARIVTSLVNVTFSADRASNPRLSPLKLRVLRALEMALARTRTHRFHAVSEAVRDDAARGLRISPDRIDVIQRGRPASDFRPLSGAERATVRRSLGIGLEVPLLVNVGRHAFAKNQYSLLRAIEELGSSRSAVLLIAGSEGTETASLRTFLQTRPDVSGRVHFLGHRSDVADILGASDLFVFPSLYEGMPGAVIEAMGCGLPIVASDIGGVAEAVAPGDGAVLVPPRDPAALAAAVANLLDDPERRARMGRRNRELFERRFTMDHSAEALIRMYRQVVADGQPSPRERRRR